MPRVVFQLLWEYLEAERPIAAYVKNMAKDGGYYWVLATVVTVADGYLSVRLKPSSELLPAVEALYAELRGVELQVERSGGTPREAMAASRARLEERLVELGFPTYDAFMQVALPTELRSREAALAVTGIQTRTRRRATGDVGTVLAACLALHEHLFLRFNDLDRYTALHSTFIDGSASVLRLADDIRLFSLNAQISAARLLDEGAALGAIANLLRVRSDATTARIREMSSQVDAIVGILATLSFDLSLATLQSEMAAQFVRELGAPIDDGVEEESEDEEALDTSALSANIAALGGCLRSGVVPLLETLEDLDARLLGVSASVASLGTELHALDALQISGRVETARLTEAGEFRLLFEEVRRQVAAGRDNLRAFDVLKSLRENRQHEDGDSMQRNLEHIQRWVTAAA